MTIYELHRNFKIELDKSGDISSYPSFLPEEIDYWYNVSIERFIKTRYSGLNIHKDGFQQSQKRSDDLRTVIKTISIPASMGLWSDSLTYNRSSVVVSDNTAYTCSVTESTLGEFVPSEWDVTTEYIFSYPSDYWIGLGDTVGLKIKVSDTESITIDRSDVIESTIENVDAKLSNSLSEHRVHNNRAKPIRLYTGRMIHLFTDGNYYISKYDITYINTPPKIDYYSFPDYKSIDDATYRLGDKVRMSDGAEKICTTESIPEVLAPLPSPHARIPAVFSNYYLQSMPDHTWGELTVNAVRLALENISDNRYQTYAGETQVIE